MKKIFSLFLVLCTLISVPAMSEFSCAAVSDEEASVFVEPRFNNVMSTTTAFAINDTGRATVSVAYTGIQGVTTRVMCKTYIEKKVLGLFWTRVDLGNTNDEWLDTSTELDDVFSHSVQLSSSGTYRAVYYIAVCGTNGDNDIIEETIEKKYSK